MKGRTPTAEEKRYMGWVASKGCHCCNILGVENRIEDVGIHHTKGRTREGAHYSVIGLCDGHHSRYKITGFHYNPTQWQKKWGRQEDIVKEISSHYMEI